MRNVHSLTKPNGWEPNTWRSILTTNTVLGANPKLFVKTDTLTLCRTLQFRWTHFELVRIESIIWLWLNQVLNVCPNVTLGMANPMSQMNSYYPGAAAAYSSLSAASMAAAAAAAAAQQNAIAGLANQNSQQVNTLISSRPWFSKLFRSEIASSIWKLKCLIVVTLQYVTW